MPLNPLSNISNSISAPAPSAAAPPPATPTSLLAPKSEADVDAEQMKREMDEDRQKHKDQESKNMDNMLNQVANDLKTEERETILNMRQTKTLEKTMQGIHNSFDRLMKL